MSSIGNGYGLWSLVVINSLVFIIFAFSFFKPATKRDWRTFGGFYLLSTAWHVLYEAQRVGQLATSGPYAKIRHPQYVAFVVIMFGFLLQWPTLVTLLMFPVLVFMYVRLAIQEERDSEPRFGQAWREYASHTPRFIPRLSGNDTDQVH